MGLSVLAATWCRWVYRGSCDIFCTWETSQSNVLRTHGLAWRGGGILLHIR